MNTWLASHFMNPALLAGGAALLAIPVIIHLINRLRYRRVRFAAMEFLLQSQQTNRRRILMEQFLLLLLRLLIVAAIVLLIARFVLDPSQFALFRESRTHHVVLLDDSSSMRERWGETSAWNEAITVVKKLAAEGARRPGTQRLTLLRLSRPDQAVISDRDVDQALVDELATTLDPQQAQPTHQAGDVAKGFAAAQKLLTADKASARQLHFVSDFREANWKDPKTMSAAVTALTKDSILVNLVKTVSETKANLGITQFSGPIETATAGIPLRLTVAVKNYGPEVAQDVRVSISDDRVKLPTAVVFDKVEPQAEVVQEIDVTLATAANHRLEATLEADPYLPDNRRFLAVDVSPELPVLIIDGQPEDQKAGYLADALAADPAVTGVRPAVENVDFLRRRPLAPYRAVYLLNVPELAPDALEFLERYVRDGGALVWFVGDQVRPNLYNTQLYREGEGLFPVPLAAAPAELPDDITNPAADLAPVGNHPIFAILQGAENPFLATVDFNKYLPAADGWVRDDRQRGGSVKTLARLRNGQPMVLEHRFGSGRVLTLLTTASPDWNDWALNPSYVVFQLDTLKYMAGGVEARAQRVAGEPIRLQLDPANYTEQVEILIPEAGGEADRTLRLLAAPETPAEAADGATPAATAIPKLLVNFTETDEPGLYTVRLLNQAQVAEDQLLSFNVPVAESELALASTDNIRKRLDNNPGVLIQEPGNLDWVEGQEAGAEVRQFLLILLALFLLGEQLLAYRLSYHPHTASVPA